MTSLTPEEKRDAGRALRRLALFLAAPAAVLGFPVAALTLSGELTPVGAVVRLQQRHPDSLYGLAYTETASYFKLESARKRRARVLVLGTSRALGFRAAFFDAPDAAFNAGRGVVFLRHMRQFLDRLPKDGGPRFVLLVLDHNMFNEKWDDRADEGPSPAIWDPGADNPLGATQASWRTVYGDYRGGKFSLRDLLGPRRRVGLAARARGTGFRPDGSYRYAGPIEDERFAGTLSLVDRGVDRMIPCRDVHPGFVKELEALLDELSRRGIAAAAVLPPFADPVRRRLLETGRHDYIAALPAALRPVFERRGVAFLDATDLSSLGGTSAEMLDGTHASEKACLRILLRLAGRSAAVRAYADPARLASLLAGAPKGPSVFAD